MDIREFAMEFFSLQGKNAIVTGGNTGLGQAFALALAKGAAASGSTLTLIKGALKIMPWTEPGRAIATGWRIIRPATIMNRAAFRLPTGMWRGIGGWGRRC